jgi:A/G-specific adenine glycosylase
MMLQQTQVDRVIPKYEAFLKRFPKVLDLAAAPLSDVLALWSGLGYNRRALFLKRIADVVTAEMKGKFPKDAESLRALPGVGPYTAAAVSTFAYNQSNVFIETNIRAAYLHEFFPDMQGVSDAQILPLITKTVDIENPREWYWALMDYGAHLKRTNPNPSRRSAHHGAQSAFKGSLREIRGGILKYFAETSKKRLTKEALLSAYGGNPERFETALAGLVKDGFLILDAKGNVSIVS